MSANSQRLSWVVWGGLGAVILFIAGAFILSQIRARQLKPSVPLIQLEPVGEFTLTNQLGQPVRSGDLRGNVWVAAIIFTRCPGPCLHMTKRMRELQAALPMDLPVHLVSLTTDPAFDTPEVLAAYGKRFGADPTRWSFLTGPREDIMRLAVNGLKLVAMEKPEADRETPEDLFIHSTLLVVVDQAGRVRASFETMPRRDVEEEDTAWEDLSAEDRFKPTRDEIVRTVRFLARGDRLLTVRDLPAVNASLNALSALLLLFGYLHIRQGRKEAHRVCMLGALASSILFLACYLTYHAYAGHTTFRNPAWFRPYYLGLLASHVVLAAAIVPLVLITVTRALRERFDRHKKIARWTWPLWMYVSVTGVLIYFILYWIFPQG